MYNVINKTRAIFNLQGEKWNNDYIQNSVSPSHTYNYTYIFLTQYISVYTNYELIRYDFFSLDWIPRFNHFYHRMTYVYLVTFISAFFVNKARE